MNPRKRPVTRLDEQQIIITECNAPYDMKDEIKGSRKHVRAAKRTRESATEPVTSRLADWLID